jgi:hypothetical protein
VNRRKYSCNNSINFNTKSSSSKLQNNILIYFIYFSPSTKANHPLLSLLQQFVFIFRILYFRKELVGWGTSPVCVFPRQGLHHQSSDQSWSICPLVFSLIHVQVYVSARLQLDTWLSLHVLLSLAWYTSRSTYPLVFSLTHVQVYLFSCLQLDTCPVYLYSCYQLDAHLCSMCPRVFSLIAIQVYPASYPQLDICLGLPGVLLDLCPDLSAFLSSA